MGNNIGGNSKAAKVMKINGEFFKLKTPTKVIDIIKDYPDHILLDSEEFLRFNLRAKPLDLDFQLKPKKIYLLFQPPKFPQTINNDNNNNNNNVVKSPLRRVKSGVLESTTTTLKELRMLMTRRSISDLSIKTKSAAVGSSHSEDGDDDGDGPVTGPTRVILKLPKAQVKRIMEESNDDAEVAQRIIRLSAAVDNSSAVVDVATATNRESGNVVAASTEGGEEMTEIEVVDRHCFSVHSMCGSNYGRKYKKLSF